MMDDLMITLIFIGGFCILCLGAFIWYIFKQFYNNMRDWKNGR